MLKDVVHAVDKDCVVDVKIMTNNLLDGLDFGQEN
jgi:hypothetical protein